MRRQRGLKHLRAYFYSFPAETSRSQVDVHFTERRPDRCEQGQHVALEETSNVADAEAIGIRHLSGVDHESLVVQPHVEFVELEAWMIRIQKSGDDVDSCGILTWPDLSKILPSPRSRSAWTSVVFASSARARPEPLPARTSVPSEYHFFALPCVVHAQCSEVMCYDEFLCGYRKGHYGTVNGVVAGGTLH